MTLAVITGTRPEIIKLFPLMRLLDINGIDYKYIHTGQHHDYVLSLKFIEEFKIRKPDYNINLKSRSNSIIQFSEIITKINNILQKFKPSLVIVQGDTNSVAASALAASKCNIPIAHVEAGLRSEDWRMAEELNRKIVDHMSHILFAPTVESASNLNSEHVHGDIHVVGNTVMDAVKLCLDLNNNNKDKLDYNIRPKKRNNTDFVLVTLHRQENVDNRDFLKQVLTALAESGLSCIFPLHPRTLKRINEFGLEDLITREIQVIEPLGYFDFLRLLKICRFVITDSGGIQEEITFPQINKHALVLRRSTERPESIKSGHTVLCKDQDHYSILQEIKKIKAMQPADNVCPYGYGNSAQEIVKILVNNTHYITKPKIAMA